MASFVVSGIRVNAYALLPVVNEKYVAPKFQAWAPLVWYMAESDSGNDYQTHPQALHIRAGRLQDFTVYASVKCIHDEYQRMKEADSSKTLKVTGTVKTRFGEPKSVGGTISVQTTFIDSLQRVDMFINVRKWDLKNHVKARKSDTDPWAFIADIDWQLQVGNEAPVQSPITTSVEVYFICPSPLLFLKDEGVPAHLLRFALGHTRSAGDDEATPYPTAITQRVFKSGFQYERSYGGSAFTGGAGDSFLLSKWLGLWTILDMTASDETRETYKLRGYGPANPPTVNCYDQAGILGLCLSLAFSTQDDYEDLDCYYMKPFGFIKDAYLVGFPLGLCNNPLTKYSKDLHVDHTSEQRSHFGNHVFLGWKDKIYDACAGPVCGTDDLDGYIKAVLDTTHPEKVYDGDGNLLTTEAQITGTDKSARSYTASNTHEGILGDLQEAVKTGPWKIPARDKLVRDLEGLPNSGKPFAFDAEGFGQWFKAKMQSSVYKVLSVSAPQVYTGAGDTKKSESTYRLGLIYWTIKVEGSDGKAHTVDFTWRVFDTAKHAQEAHTSQLGGGTALANTVQDSLLSGTVGDFRHAIAVHGRHSLDVSSKDLPISTVKTIAIDISDYGTGIKPTDEMTVQYPEADPGSSCCQSCPLKVEYASEVKFTVQTKNVAYIDWTYETGNVFLLDYNVDKNGLYSFKFYGRNTNDDGKTDGADEVHLVFYDRYYNSTRRSVKFTIKPTWQTSGTKRWDYNVPN